jgi:hypothetical protein
MIKKCTFFILSLFFHLSGFSQTLNFQKTNGVSEVEIGTTYYDLQTQASIPARLIRHQDGTMSAVWIQSALPSAPYADRGTGYAYFNGSGWLGYPKSRIETTRSGWPSIAQLSNGTEFIVSHHSTQIQAAYRPLKGNGPWTEDTVTLKRTFPKGIFWPRIIAGGAQGNSLHIIALTQPGAFFAGLNGALTYSRSVDGGKSWDILHSIIPSIDSTQYLGFGSDNYAIDAKGDTIVILIGGYDKDVVLLKSVNNGSSWTKKIVSAFPLVKYNSATTTTDINKDGIADTIKSNDGAMAVLLDKSGMAHVFFGKMLVYCNNPGKLSGQGLRIFPYTDSLMYWNENMLRKPYGIAGVNDRIKNGKLDLPLMDDPSKFPFGIYSVSLTSHPSAALDSNGTIYLAYSSVLEDITKNRKVFRHTYITKTDDGGKTWASTPVDVFPDLNTECVFGSLARRVDGYIHLLYQLDYNPGISINPNGGSSSDPENNYNPSSIMYAKIKKNLTMGIHQEVNDFICNLYPNPATNGVFLEMNLEKSEAIHIKLINTLGQEIFSLDEDEKSSGFRKIPINVSNLPSGIYFIHVVTGNIMFSKKLQVNDF